MAALVLAALSLRPVVDIALPRKAVFCSCVSDNRGGFTCYYRRDATTPTRRAQLIYLSSEFNVIAVGNTTIEAEDPRVFLWGDNIVALDNYYNDMHVVWENNRRVRVPLSGKNLSPLPTAASTITFFDIQQGYRHRCTLAGDQMHCRRPERLAKVNAPSQCSPRGGTAALSFNGIIWGVGHCTYPTVRSTVVHSIIGWSISRDTITYFTFKPPAPLANIVDPASVVNKSGQLYLITAESTHTWFAPWDTQLFSNRVYQLLSTP